MTALSLTLGVAGRSRRSPPRLGPALAKEVRAIALPWGLSLVLPAMVAVLTADAFGCALGWAVYALSSALVAATLFGHDFTHGTLGLALTLPSDRGFEWRRKHLVLGAALSLTAGVFLGVLWLLGVGAGEALPRATGLALGTVGVVFCTGAWLTLGARQVLGGTVFTCVIPWLLVFLVTEGMGVALAGVLAPESDWAWLLLEQPRPEWFGYLGPLALAGLAYAGYGWRAGRRRFLRLEAIETGAGPLVWPGWLEAKTVPFVRRARASGPRRPSWHLVLKELRLQSLAWWLSGGLVLVWGVQVLARSWWPAVMTTLPLELMLFAAVQAVLLGAVACAEERSLETLAWHAVLPLTSLRQWMIKSGVVLALALGLGVLLPWLLLCATPAALRPPLALAPGEWSSAIGAVLLLSGLGLYMSSRTPTTLQAFVWGIAGGLTALLLLQTAFVGLAGLWRGESGPWLGRALMRPLTWASAGLGSASTPLGELAARGALHWLIGFGAVLTALPWLVGTVGLGWLGFRRLPAGGAHLAGHLALLGLALALHAYSAASLQWALERARLAGGERSRDLAVPRTAAGRTPVELEEGWFVPAPPRPAPPSVTTATRQAATRPPGEAADTNGLPRFRYGLPATGRFAGPYASRPPGRQVSPDMVRRWLLLDRLPELMYASTVSPDNPVEIRLLRRYGLPANAGTQGGAPGPARPTSEPVRP
ncbi:MAG: hypothetical protein FJ387_02225 [Verrucomicrobia bacterium]|nr:hypothetical protein [Verrucomicrobiota bacterium]